MSKGYIRRLGLYFYQKTKKINQVFAYAFILFVNTS
jgi:hypothetical protein